MKHILILTALICVHLQLLHAQNDSIIVPEWYKNPPPKAGVLYGVGYAANSNLETAERMAKLNAQRDLIKKTNTVFYVFVSKCDTILGANSKASETIKTIRDECSATLKNVIDSDKKVFTTNNSYIYYYLLEQKTDEVLQLFKQKIKSNESIKHELSDKKLLTILNELK